MKKLVLTAVFITLVFNAAPLVSADFEPVSGSISGTTIQVAPAAADLYAPLETRTVWITAYSSTADQTDDTPFITASGRYVRDGVIAANFLPFGAKIIIPSLFGNKIFTVEDRMSSKKKNNVDIWMITRKGALDFGAHYANITVVYNPNTDSLIALK